MASDWVYKVRSNTMQKRLSADLEKGLFTDVTFRVGPEKNRRTFKAHRVVLASENPVFEKLFNESKSEEIVIPDVHPKAFENLVRYCYGASFAFKDLVAVRETHLAAEKFKAPKLKLAAEIILIDLLKSEPVLEVLDVCIELNLSKAKIRCLQKISSEFDKVLMTEELALAPFDVIWAILSLCPGYASEFNIFAVCTLMEWAKAHECPESYISYLISKIPYGTVDEAISFLRTRILKFTESQLRAFHKYFDPEVPSLKKHVRLLNIDTDISQNGTSISKDRLSEVKETSTLESEDPKISRKGTSNMENKVSEEKETPLKEMVAKIISKVFDLNDKKDIDGEEKFEQKSEKEKEADSGLDEENAKMDDEVAQTLRKEAVSLIQESAIASCNEMLKSMVETADQMTQHASDNIQNAINEMVNHFKYPLILKD